MKEQRKGIWKAIAYFALYFGSTMIFQMLLSIAFMAIGAMLMALVFGYIFYKFESLWICMIAHAVANLPDFILYNKPDISGGMFFGLIIFFVCLFIAGLYVIHKTTQNDNT